MTDTLAIAYELPPAVSGQCGPALAEFAFVSIAEDEPADGELLPVETRTYASLRVPKRRREWLAGRRAAKEVVRRRHAAGTIEIAAIPAGYDAGRPFYRIDGAPGPFGLSIAHSGGVAVAALAADPGHRVGVDLEPVLEREEIFENVAFTLREISCFAAIDRSRRPRITTVAWVLKECLVKAVGSGLRVALTAIEVLPATMQLSGTARGRITDFFALADPLSVAESTVVLSLFDAGENVVGAVVLEKGEGELRP